MINDNDDLLVEFDLKKAKNDVRRFSNAFNKVTNKQKYYSLGKLIDKIDNNIDILSMVSEKERDFNKIKKTYLKDGVREINQSFNNEMKDVYGFYKSLLTKDNFIKNSFTPKKNIKLKSGGDIYFSNDFGDYKIGNIKQKNGTTYELIDYNGKSHKFKRDEFMGFIEKFVFENYISFSNTEYVDKQLKVYLNDVTEIIDRITSEVDGKYLSTLLEVSIGKRLAVKMLRGYNTVYSNLANAVKNIKNKGDVAKLLFNIKKSHQNSIKKLELYLDTTERYLAKKRYSAKQRYLLSIKTLENSKKNNSWKNSFNF